MEEEKVAQIFSEEIYKQKFERIKEWAKMHKKNLSKDMNLDEINSFIDDILYPNIKTKLNSLKAEKNEILRLMFPQLINNLFESFDLFNNIKFNLFLDLKMEMNKYSNLLIKSEENENRLNNKINECKKQLKQSKINIEKERADFIAKINAMDEELKKMKEKYSSKEKTLENDNNNFSPGKYEDIVDLNKSLFVMNETYVSD